MCYLEVVIGTGGLRVVLDVEGVVEVERDGEALLQLDAVDAVGALGVRLGEI